MLHSKTERFAVPSSSEFADDAEMFELAPVSLWLEDYSGLKALFERWRAEGVISLRDYLLEDATRVKACSSQIRVIKVNRRTLSLFEADDLSHLVGNLDRIFRNDMLKAHIDELVQLWDGRAEFFSNTVNYYAARARLDIQLKGSVLPGHEGRLGSRPDRHRGCDRARSRAQAALHQRNLRPRPVRAFAGLAVGGGFQRGQAAARTMCVGRESATFGSSPTCIRNSSSAA